MSAHRLWFPWTATAAVLHRLWKLCGPQPDEGSGSFLCEELALTCTPPAVQDLRPEDDTLPAYLERLEQGIGTQVILLVRAGTSALGLWSEDDLLAHKMIHKYVVRGSGRAQPAHLKTRGKSRYGSRLRLQGARAQLQETNRRLLDWRVEFGPERRLFLSAPVRLLADLKRARPAPPEELAHASRIPFQTREPSHAELLRVRRRLCQGVLSGPAEVLEVVRREWD